jgi:hypothetical protein
MAVDLGVLEHGGPGGVEHPLHHQPRVHPVFPHPREVRPDLAVPVGDRRGAVAVARRAGARSVHEIALSRGLRGAHEQRHAGRGRQQHAPHGTVRTESRP